MTVILVVDFHCIEAYFQRILVAMAKLHSHHTQDPTT